MKKIPPNNPKIENGLVQLIRMGKYIRHIWVKDPIFLHVKARLLCWLHNSLMHVFHVIAL